MSTKKVSKTPRNKITYKTNMSSEVTMWKSVTEKSRR